MSQQLINHSPDLKQLRDEGYEVEIKGNFLLIHGVPYVTATREIKLGTLVSDINLAGNITAKPNTHVVHFIGSHPCNKDGTPIHQIHAGSNNQKLTAELKINHTFSNKPLSGYNDYFEKMTRYIEIISAPAQSIDALVTAKTFKVIESQNEESVFNYFDSHSSRAGINLISEKLEKHKIGVIGVGGTGSYILDLIAKTPVKEIHLFDGDCFLQHNAFRAPGAPSLSELKDRPKKVEYFHQIYSKMRKNIYPHNFFIDSANLDQLVGLNFVFLCLDKGEVKKIIIDKLEELGIAFIDVGMGLEIINESLIGTIRVTTSTNQKRKHVRDKSRIPFSDGNGNEEYSQNIQIADLNALNAAMAVIKWKKLCGFYQDLGNEHHNTYTLNDNRLLSDDYNET